VPVRAHPTLSSLSSPSSCSRVPFNVYAYARCRVGEEGAGSGVYACVWDVPCHRSRSCSSSSDQGGVSVCTAAGIAVFFLREYGEGAPRGSGYTFSFGWALARQWTWGWRICVGALWVRGHCSLPSLALAFVSLLGLSYYLSLQTRSELYFLHHLVYALPLIPIHVRMAIPLNETSS
jgi:hypothetical protein